ncbi:MAG: TadE/TadG family type IV pilus assembly protein [Caulobacteraceae bacterium]
MTNLDMAAPHRKRLRSLGGDERAATAVEFALLISPLLALIMGSLQIFLVFFAGQVLQSAAISAGRQLMTGADQQASMTQSQFQQSVCNAAPILFTCTNIMVDVESAASYAALSTATPTVTYDKKGNVTNNWSYTPGGAGDIVILRVMYDWPVIGGPAALGLANQANGSHLLVATSVFKNEPY